MGIKAVGPGLDGITQALNGIAAVDGYAVEAAKAVDAHLASTIAAGTTPSGEAWQAKEDGSKPLRNAKKAVTVRAVGSSVVIELKGVEVFHQYGAGASPVREIIPKEVDEKLGQAIRRGVVKGFEKKTGGRK